jgi:glycosyltransferase involved in cell wall biosynthesis
MRQGAWDIGHMNANGLRIVWAAFAPFWAKYSTIGKIRHPMSNTHAPPLVSVLMPAYNHAPYVRAAVESVLGQTYENLELIAIDDASSDATWEILQSFEDERLRLYRHDANQGAHATLNELMGRGRGRHFAILNSDDIYHPLRLERLVAEAERSSDRDTLIFTDVSFVDKHGFVIDADQRALSYKALSDRCASFAPYFRLLTGNQAISTSNFFFSRSLAEKIGAFAPLRYTHDWDWALRANIHGAATWVRESLLSYRVHGGNTLSEDDTWRHIHENSYVQAKALMALKGGITEDEKPAAAMRSACLALLENESFHPLALSLYLTCLLGGIEDQEMLALTCIRDGNWILKDLADAASCPDSLFRSIDHLAQKDEVVRTQAAIIEERWQIIQTLSEEISKRDTCIAAQTRLIEEKDRGIAAQTELIEKRDQLIAAQTGLIEEKDRGIAAQTRLIEEKDRGIAAQTGLIEEKDRGIAAQTELIKERDQYINVMRSEIADQSCRIARLEEELSELYGSRVVRMGMAIRRILGQLTRAGRSSH